MTGVLQTHARRYRIPIDTVSFSFQVLEVRDPREIKQGAEDGVYVHGLFMDGARWDDSRQLLADSPLGELISEMPVIHFLPKVQKKPHRPPCRLFVMHYSIRGYV